MLDHRPDREQDHPRQQDLQCKPHDGAQPDRDDWLSPAGYADRTDDPAAKTRHQYGRQR